jgi:hypothetical protein
MMPGPKRQCGGYGASSNAGSSQGS